MYFIKYKIHHIYVFVIFFSNRIYQYAIWYLYYWLTLKQLGCSSGFQGLFLSRVKQPGHEAGHSPPYSAKVKNWWSFTCAPPCVSMLCRCTALSYCTAELFLHSVNINTKQTFIVVRTTVRKHVYSSEVEYVYPVMFTLVSVKNTSVYMQFISVKFM
jgi:hypothetical protein